MIQVTVMRRTSLLLAALGLVASTSPLLAEDSVNPTSPLTRRQLADCMIKRMNANRTLSYNDAAKACKDQLRGRKSDAALNHPPKPLS
jgi:hypothetical protein